jgi:hypothetical protein
MAGSWYIKLRFANITDYTYIIEELRILFTNKSAQHCPGVMHARKTQTFMTGVIEDTLFPPYPSNGGGR